MFKLFRSKIELFDWIESAKIVGEIKFEELRGNENWFSFYIMTNSTPFWGNFYEENFNDFSPNIWKSI